MASTLSLYMAGKTDVGLARDHNEDAIAWDAELGYALLADGMGGHSAGDVASRLSLESLQQTLAALNEPLRLRPNKGVSRHATLVRRAVNYANTAIFEYAEANPECKGMGTTLVVVVFYDDRAVVAHVGDSRVYRLRGKQLTQMTADHSLVRELLEQGAISEEEAVDNPYSHVITKAVGVRSNVVAEVQEFPASPGDVYMLCSDGLTDLVSDAQIAETLTAASGQWERAAQHLVDLANQLGGHDNISVVIAAVGGPR